MRISCENGDPRRTHGPEKPPGQGQEKTCAGLIPAREVVLCEPVRAGADVRGPGWIGKLAVKQTSNSRGRLKLKSEFSAVRDQAQKQVCFLAVMLYTGPDPADQEPRCGVICSRKFDKRAVRRNRARRVLHEAFRLIRQELKPCRIIFIPRRPILDQKMQDVARQLRIMFQRAELFRNSRT